MKDNNKNNSKKIPSKDGFIEGRNGGRLRPQQKGEPSHNPSGKPKGTRNRSTIMKKWITLDLDKVNPLSGKKENLEVEEHIALALIMKAFMGDVQAAKEILDTVYGKVKDVVQHEQPKEKMTSFSFADGVPLSITVTNPQRFYTEEEIVEKYKNSKNENDDE